MAATDTKETAPASAPSLAATKGGKPKTYVVLVDKLFLVSGTHGANDKVNGDRFASDNEIQEFLDLGAIRHARPDEA